MAKKQSDALKDRNPLTAKEAADLALLIADHDEKRTARLLLLLHAFTYEPGRDDRYHMFYTVEGTIADSLIGFEGFVRDAMRPTLDALREGGAP
jgi:hypothetical protein